MNKLIKILPFLIPVSLFSCDDDDPVEEDNTGSIKLVVNILNDGEALELDSKEYTNEAGNVYTVTEFKFYLSNVKLRNTSTGAFYLEPDSYHLVERLPESNVYEIEIDDVPIETYNQLEFAVGVDNGKNYSLDNVGALDPTNNMAWDWNTGYKFLLLEGRHLNGSDTPAGLVMHIGSDSNYKTIKLSTDTVEIAQGKEAVYNINAEISQIFKEPNTIDFTTNNVVMFDSIANKVAANYANNMFSISSVED
ncbi:MbnP family protein [Chondrinema litorale]|uniref:MbnP family protein n=1 Tax=Chondrinema litorale TaxID=2994555 RepID=UPI0025433000|nr:MbnP family protein [Chondrinema litorale]UZR98754.1 hypothetical protein OQ292_33445 [Chondrinema litorale]